MDDGNSPDYTFTPGSGTLEECAAAVQQLDGTNGCMGDYFFYESNGYCNCPTDDCSLPSENNNAGGTGQLYKFTGNDDDGSGDDDDGSPSGCTTTAYYWDGSSDVSSHDSSKCNEHSCGTVDGDCCGFDFETWCADGFTLVRGNQPGDYCWPGAKGYKCLPPSTSASPSPTPSPTMANPSTSADPCVTIPAGASLDCGDWVSFHSCDDTWMSACGTNNPAGSQYNDVTMRDSGMCPVQCPGGDDDDGSGDDDDGSGTESTITAFLSSPSLPHVT